MRPIKSTLQPKKLSLGSKLHRSVAEVELAPNWTASGIVSKSDLGNLMRAEIHRKHSILQGGPQRHGVSPKGFAYPKVPILKRDLSLILNFTHNIAGAIFNRRQNLRKAPQADLIAAGGDRHAQRLVRSLVVVDLTPLIKLRLHLAEITKHWPGQHLRFQGAVKPFFLALRLRMLRPPMSYPHTQTHQPNRQGRVGMIRITPPRRAIIHQHRLWQSIAAKRGGQLLLHRLSLLVSAGLQAQRKAGMIVEHRQADDTAARCPTRNAL